MLNKKPYSARVLFPLFAEVIQRFNYWGIQSVIVLYAIQSLSMLEKNAILMFGVFSSLTFAISVVGGVLSDKWFGFKNVLLFGMLLSLAGLITLVLHRDAILGFSFLATGMGFFLPNNANYFNSFYHSEDIKREKGFSLFYVATNLGALLGPLTYGYLAFYKWEYAFYFGIGLLCVWWCFYFSAMRVVFQLKNYLLLFCGFVVVSVAYYCFLHPTFIEIMLIISGTLAIAFITMTILKRSNIEKSYFLCLLMMLVGALIFFIFAFQIYTSLLIFIQHVVDRKLFNWVVPTSVFSSLEPMFVVILTVIVINLRSQTKKVMVGESYYAMRLMTGFALCSIGFALFSFSAFHAYHASQNISLLWVVAGNACLAAGEICIMPSLLAAITALAPQSLRSSTVGILYFALAFSGFFSGKIAGLAGGLTIHFSVYHYGIFYSEIAAVSMTIGLLALLVYCWYRKNSMLLMAG